MVPTFHCLNKLFVSSQNVCKFSAFSLQFQKILVRTIFSHSRSEQFWKQNINPCFFWNPFMKKFQVCTNFLETLKQFRCMQKLRFFWKLHNPTNIILNRCHLSSAFYQCWTVGAIFTLGRSRMFGPDKLRLLAVGRSRSRRKKTRKTCVFWLVILPTK